MLSLRITKEGASGKVATAVNRTRKIRLSGIRGWLAERWTKDEMETRSTTEKAQSGQSHLHPAKNIRDLLKTWDLKKLSLVRLTAFTLLELLIVIAIITILASMALPALLRAKGTVNQTSCLNNLKNLGISTVYYSNDNDLWFPIGYTDTPRRYWIQCLADTKSINNEWLEITQKTSLLKPSYLYCPQSKYNSNYSSYGFNQYLFGYDSGTDPHYLNIKTSKARPSNYMFADKFVGWGTSFYWNNNMVYNLGSHHSRGSNVLYVDGSGRKVQTPFQNGTYYPKEGMDSLFPFQTRQGNSF